MIDNTKTYEYFEKDIAEGNISGSCNDNTIAIVIVKVIVLFYQNFGPKLGVGPQLVLFRNFYLERLQYCC